MIAITRRPLVLHVDDGAGVWGAQRYLLRLAPLLEARGIEQRLAAPVGSELETAWRATGRPSDLLARQPVRDVRDADGRFRLGLAAGQARMVAGRSAAIARLARISGADLISANSHWTHLDAVVAGRLARTPVLLHLHEEAAPGIAVRLRSVSVHLATATLAVSRDVAGRLTPAAAARTTVVPNGVDADEFHPGPADPAVRAQLTGRPEAPVVLSLSRLDPDKRVDHVIGAVSRLDGVHLAIAGRTTTDTGEERRLRDLADRLLGDRARWLGVRADTPELLRAADAFTLTGRREGLPLGILEAQASGCPAVAYPAAGVADAIVDGETGLIADDGDPASLASCLHRVLTDEVLRRRLSAAARKRVVAEFSLTGQADTCARLIKAALA